MNKRVELGRFSIGMGDRFARQAEAQLRACVLTVENGVDVTPVWNKSNREHIIIGSEPASVRIASEKAVKKLGWKKSWHIDADHIRMETVDWFIPHSDFYTIDVADSIGKVVGFDIISKFCDRHPELVGNIEIPGISEPFRMSRMDMEYIVRKYLPAIEKAGKIYRHIAKTKGEGNFITEISMDETDSPQTPPELLIILAAMADEKIPLQTIAPKFTGRFNKGVDYVGDIEQFEREFNEDLAVIALAVPKYGLPENLKLSVHSGSDKFSIYKSIRRALKKFNAGLHIKTAGTTWLEELIGLAEADGDAFLLAKEIYCDALEHRDELCTPYATVVDIDPQKLPSKEQVDKWTSQQFVSALRHDPKCKDFNPDFRQLLHVGFKVAAKKGNRYLRALEQYEAVINKNVTENLFERHLKPLFICA